MLASGSPHGKDCPSGRSSLMNLMTRTRTLLLAGIAAASLVGAASQVSAESVWTPHPDSTSCAEAGYLGDPTKGGADLPCHDIGYGKGAPGDTFLWGQRRYGGARVSMCDGFTGKWTVVYAEASPQAPLFDE